jgi:hypothetical protein
VDAGGGGVADGIARCGGSIALRHGGANDFGQ